MLTVKLFKAKNKVVIDTSDGPIEIMLSLNNSSPASSKISIAAPQKCIIRRLGFAERSEEERAAQS